MHRRQFIKLLGTTIFLPFASKPRQEQEWYARPDMGTGTVVDPFTLTEALASGGIKPGDTVYLRGGVYRQPLEGLWTFRGGEADAPVTWKAYEGERPILSKDTDIAPRISVENYCVLDGLWLGGRWPLWETDANGFMVDNTSESGNHAISMGAYCEIKNCTLWGYHQGPVEGAGHHNLYSGNRFVRCGRGEKHHGIYISVSGSADKFSTIQDCIFTHGEGLALSCWHGASRLTIQRNFFGKHWVTFGMNGSNQTVADNIAWKAITGDGWNKMAHLDRVENTTLSRTFFCRPENLTNVTDSTTHVGAVVYESDVAFYGGTPTRITSGQEQAYLGVTEQQIDDAIDALDTLFAGTVEEIAATPDATIERHFAVMQTAIDTWGRA